MPLTLTGVEKGKFVTGAVAFERLRSGWHLATRRLMLLVNRLMPFAFFVLTSVILLIAGTIESRAADNRAIVFQIHNWKVMNQVLPVPRANEKLHDADRGERAKIAEYFLSVVFSEPKSVRLNEDSSLSLANLLSTGVEKFIAEFTIEINQSPTAINCVVSVSPEFTTLQNCRMHENLETEIQFDTGKAPVNIPFTPDMESEKRTVLFASSAVLQQFMRSVRKP